MDVGYEELRGRTVIDAKGRALGELQGVVIDTDSWRLRALRVKLRAEVADALGERRGRFRAAVVEVPVDFVSGVTDAIVLNRPVETFAGEAAAAPTPAP